MLSNHLTSIQRNYKLLALVFVFIACATKGFSDRVKSELNDRSEEFTLCYQAEIKKNDRKELKGNIILDFKIDRVGVVKKAKIQNSYWMSDEFKGCILQKLNETVFTPATNGATSDVILAVNFYPREK